MPAHLGRHGENQNKCYFHSATVGMWAELMSYLKLGLKPDFKNYKLKTKKKKNDYHYTQYLSTRPTKS